MPLTQVSSRAIEDTLRYVLGASGTNHYTFTGKGLNGAVNDPTIYLVRGQTYIFENRSGGHPFYIKTSIANGGTNDAYNTGVTNNGGGNNTEIVFTVPHDAPDTLYYQCSSHSSMAGEFKIAGSVADGSITESKLADDAVTADKLANSINSAIAANTAKDLTALSASNLTSGTVPDARFPATLPAISGANLTNLPAGGKTKNIMINGAMNVAQRGTSSTSNNGYYVCDRWDQSYGSTDEAPTFSQEDVTAGGAYDAGFSKCLRITNGNQTSGAGADDYISVGYAFESQDLQNSGWQFKNSSSKVTLSFWVKSSVAQEFFGQFLVPTVREYNFHFGTGVLQANTWTKVTKTIPGNSTLGIPNTYNQGARIYIWPFAGTNLTGSITNDAWMANNYSTRTSDHTTTWYTTNDATLELTGFQLETGDTASDFVFETYGETLLKCKRYCHVIEKDQYSYLGNGMQYYSGTIFIDGGKIDMRTTPTMVAKSGVSGAYVYEKIFGNSAEYIHQISLDGKTTKDHVFFNMAGTASRHGEAVRCACHAVTLNNNEPFVYLQSEL